MAKPDAQCAPSANCSDSHHLRRTAAALAVAACFSTSLVLANPSNPTVVHGTATFASAGNILNITNSQNAVINWGSFSIGINELTRFIQPSALSAVLNRVTGQDPSAILGALQSNGRVFLINPNGITFGAGAQIDVAGLVASTLNLSNDDFLNNRLRFTDGAGAGSVVNQGSLTGGSVYLVGKAVSNEGLITSPNGEVVLAAGNSVELVNPGTPDLRVEIVAPDNEAVNLGTIAAEAGRIGIYAGLIHNSGTLNASSAVAEGGRILLKAMQNTTLAANSMLNAGGTSGGKVDIESADTTLVDGSVIATGIAGHGGTVHVLGDKVGLVGSANLDVSGVTGGGTVLVGGDFQGKNLDVQNAFRTYVGPDATIKVDAITSGDGGKVVIWSDDATRFYGNISARGGAQSGNGGFVEVSGKRWLDYNGLTNTRAPHGATGTLLLDPSNITIDNVAGDTGSFDGAFFLSGTLPAHIQWATIKTALETSNAIISTSSGAVASEAGDITIAADSPDLASSNRLELLADNSIFVNGKITNTDAASVVVLNAGNNIEQNASGAITAGGLLAQASNGHVKLDAAPNMVGTLAGTSQREFRFKNNQSLTIGTVNAVSGISIEGAEGGVALVDINVLTGNLTVSSSILAQGYNASYVDAGSAEVKLTAAGGITTVNSSVTAQGGDCCVYGSGGEAGGAGKVEIKAAGAVSVVNSSVQALGGDGGETASGGAATVTVTGGAGITVSNSTLLVAAGSAGSGQGGAATLALGTSGGGIQIDGSEGSAFGGGGATGGSAVVAVLSAGGITVSNSYLRASGGFGGSSVRAPAAIVLAAAGDVALSNTSYPNIYSTGSVGIAGANVSLDNADVSASGILVVGATGNLDVLNSSALTGGGNATIGVIGDVTVDRSRIAGNPEVTMTVGGVINMNGTLAYGGTIEAGSEQTIFVNLPNLTSGGYFVNGVEGVVYDSDTSTGFVAVGNPAILDTNLFITYGGTTVAPPTDALLVAMGESTKPPDAVKDKDIFSETEDEKKKDAPVCR